MTLKTEMTANPNTIKILEFWELLDNQEHKDHSTEIGQLVKEYPALLDTTEDFCDQSYTPLQHAAKWGKPKALRALVENMGEKNIDSLNDALHSAAENSQVICARILIENGADPIEFKKNIIATMRRKRKNKNGTTFERKIIESNLHFLQEAMETSRISRLFDTISTYLPQS